MICRMFLDLSKWSLETGMHLQKSEKKLLGKRQKHQKKWLPKNQNWKLQQSHRTNSTVDTKQWLKWISCPSSEHRSATVEGFQLEVPWSLSILFLCRQRRSSLVVGLSRPSILTRLSRWRPCSSTKKSLRFTQTHKEHKDTATRKPRVSVKPSAFVMQVWWKIEKLQRKKSTTNWSALRFNLA